MDSSYRVPRKKMDRRLGAQVITVVLAWCWHHLVWGQTDQNLDYLRGAGNAGGAGAAQPRVYSIGPFTVVVQFKMRPFTFVVLIRNNSVQTHLMFRMRGDAGGAGAAQPRVYSIGPFIFLVNVEMSPSTFLVLTKNCSVQTHLTFRMTGNAGGAGAAQPRAARPPLVEGTRSLLLVRRRS